MESTDLDEAPSDEGARDASHSGRSLFDPIVLFALLVAFYHVNGAVWINGEITGNVALGVSLLNEGNLSITPAEAPRMFRWRYTRDGKSQDIYVHSWAQLLEGQPMRDRFARGEIERVGYLYQLQPTKRDPRGSSTRATSMSYTATPGLPPETSIG